MSLSGGVLGVCVGPAAWLAPRLGWFWVIRGEAAIQRISAVELATRAGLNRTTVGRRLRMERAMSVAELEGFAQALGWPLARLIAAGSERLAFESSDSNRLDLSHVDLPVTLDSSADTLADGPETR